MAQVGFRWPRGDCEMAAHIRDLDWSATPLGPLSCWPQSLKTIVDLMLGSPSMMSLVWGPEAIHLYNDAFTELLREHRTLALGRSAYETFAQARDVFEADIAAGMAGRPARLTAQRYPVLRGGKLQDAWFDVDYAPVRDEAGEVAGVLWTLKETTAQHLAEQALRESEARLRLLIGSWAQAVWETDATGVVTTDSPSWRAHTGQSLEEWLGYGWLDAIHPDDRAYAERQWREAVAAQRLVDAEFRLRAPDGGWRWTNVRAAPVLDAAGNVEKWAGMNIDIKARKTAEATLRQSEERQAFLLKLSDALRAEPNTDAVANRALRMLRDQMAVDRCYIAIMWVEANRADYTHQVGNDRVPPMPASVRLSDFPKGMQVAFDRTLVIDDLMSDADLSEVDRQSLDAFGHRSLIAAFLRKGERNAPLWVLVGVSADPRPWSTGDVALVEDVAERTWGAVERVRSEAALRLSEARFQQFAKASAAGLWIRDAKTLAMEFVSPAVGSIYGVEPDALLGDVSRWAALIVPEDRDVALDHLEKARGGAATVHEFRIQRPADGIFRWIRNTDFPLHDEHGRVERIGGIAEDVTQTKLAVEHTGVLLAELQHRVRNIMGMIRSMANRTAVGAVDTRDYRTLLEGRLLALARVQALLTRQANAGGSLREVIESEVAAQAHHGGQFVLTGPDIVLSPKAVEVLTLAFHELATNALKYGALSVPEGRLTVTWRPVARERPWVSVDWTEVGAPAREPSTRRGFGSELIEGRIPYELGGRGKITIGPEGARCHLEFPLTDGESILETDAPQPTIVFGGALDMTGAPDLTGRTVLVVEDDYFIASDTAAGLRGAGADVLGPCANESATRDLLTAETPTHAVLDLNLGGGGPRFELAQMLRARGVPFIFLTGYDPDVIPPDLSDVVRLQKPLPFRAIVEAVGRL